MTSVIITEPAQDDIDAILYHHAKTRKHPRAAERRADAIDKAIYKEIPFFPEKFQLDDVIDDSETRHYPIKFGITIYYAYFADRDQVSIRHVLGPGENSEDKFNPPTR